MNHYVSVWANAMSIADARPEGYAKDITLRYPILMPFKGNKIQITLDNFTGKEPVTFHQVTLAKTTKKEDVDASTITQVTFDGQKELTLEPGQSIVSDEIEMDVERGEFVSVSIYLGDYTQMRCAVTTIGPLTKGFYALGNQCDVDVMPRDFYKEIVWFYFLSRVDLFTDEKNQCVLCYGDSITAQNWPEELQLRLFEANSNLTCVRRAVSGARVLRQYDCTMYEAYGLKGKTRFPHEIGIAGCDSMMNLQGINDFIHPVGVETNPFRPWSDLPDAKTLIEDGLMYYADYAHEHGYKNIYIGTLLPIKGWRTYQPFRNELRKEVNEWIRTTDKIEGYVDFDKAVQNPEDIDCLRKDCDSGDHLHPSPNGYKEMAKAAFEFLTK